MSSIVRAVWITALAAGAVGVAGCNPAQQAGAQPRRADAAPAGQPGLQAFTSDDDLRRFLTAQRARQQELSRAEYGPAGPPPAVSTPPSMAQSADADTAARSSVEGESAGAQPSITNVQEAGVDEGGIVKVRGDTLVILRRGRLFTVSTAGGGLRAIDSVEAYPPGVDASGDWYDEMLISGDRVIVIGYSYARGGTEVSRFRLAADGQLSFEDAYHLKSNDYYSSRNYASRLIGDQLVLYTPLYLNWESDPLEALPAVRRWTGRPDAPFRRITSGTQVFIAPALRGETAAPVTAVHSLIRCDLSAPVLDCDATAVLGPDSRTFYVSSSAVYLWLTAYREREDAAPDATLYRLPLAGSRPSAVAVRGGPTDQFSFREDVRDGVLNVAVRNDGSDDAMWSPEFSSGKIALLRLPLSTFGDGSREAARDLYRVLPGFGDWSYDYRNRFVGRHLLVSASLHSGGGRAGRGAHLVVAPIAGGVIAEFPLPHDVNRLEVMGGDALAVGERGEDLLFSTIELGRAPALAPPWTMRGARETESRSHGFFYRPDTADGSEGVIGLPVARPAPRRARSQVTEGAATLFLRRLSRRFSPLGELEAGAVGSIDDGCVASCTDWYGNARPIFLGRRTFALMGYELIEGELGQDSIREVRRMNFAPE